MGVFSRFFISFPWTAGDSLELRHSPHEQNINTLLFGPSSKASYKMLQPRGISEPEPNTSENTPWGLFLRQLAIGWGFRLQVIKHCKTKCFRQLRTDFGKFPTLLPDALSHLCLPMVTQLHFKLIATFWRQSTWASNTQLGKWFNHCVLCCWCCAKCIPSH